MRLWSVGSRRIFRPAQAAGCFAAALLLLSFEFHGQVLAAAAEDTLASRIRAAMAADGFSPAAIAQVLLTLSAKASLEHPVQPGYRLAVLRDTAPSGEVVSASLSLPQEPIGEYGYYRFRTSDGRFDFYDDLGRSAARRMQRSPLAGPDTGIRAAFGFGRAQENRMHTGVDWHAPPGTPVVATGDGMARVVHWGDEGAAISIDHGGGYQTTYSPVAAVPTTFRAGAPVAKGERLGLVESDPSGSSGLFYQLIVNSRFTDPLRTRLPSTHRLEGDVLSEFLRERDRLRALATDARSYELFALK